MVEPGRSSREWTLWVVAGACALHALEEYLTGWQAWAVGALGINMPTALFLLMNSVLVMAACALARLGWSRPTLSLVIPSATLVNAVFFHILPTLIQGRASPGVYTAALLYVPFSSWALVGAKRDGVPGRSIAFAGIAGVALMMAVVLVAQRIGVPNRIGP
jgi:Protein of unknown function with HXXEE motif